MNRYENRGKIFMTYKSVYPKFTVIAYPFGTHSYLNYLNEYNKKGYNQFPLTDDILISLFNIFAKKYKFDIDNIEFVRDDDDVKPEIDSIIGENEKNYTQKILSQVKKLSESYVVEIEFIEAKNYENDTFVKIRNNGIVTTDKRCYKQIKGSIENYLNDEVQKRSTS